MISAWCARRVISGVMRFLQRMIMNLLRVFLLVVLALVSATAIHAKDWRGITPLHSTRADVDRLLGRTCSIFVHSSGSREKGSSESK
jgi:hypothetical protein